MRITKFFPEEIHKDCPDEMLAQYLTQNGIDQAVGFFSQKEEERYTAKLLINAFRKGLKIESDKASNTARSMFSRMQSSY